MNIEWIYELNELMNIEWINEYWMNWWLLNELHEYCTNWWKLNELMNIEFESIINWRINVDQDK